ncbi:DUF2065 domain-containing protein [Agrobacterium sp. ES01]|uniref:DUF2065 domain-containing protein n=1 Tax=Agrobacterium sp. ES01 TaxID=3420714 RepID=UPI003D143111
MSDFLTGLAFFLIIEGLIYALAPHVVVMMAKLLPSIPEQQLRLSGLIAMGIGVFLVWIIRF